MKTSTCLTAVAFTLIATPISNAQLVEINSLSQNGLLSWTHAYGTNAFSVEWASSAAGPWHRDWEPLASWVIYGGESTSSTSVPMFYRVLQGFSIETLRGVWMRVDVFPYTNNHYYVVQRDGVITETSEFGTRMPPGFCTLLTTNWYATNFNYSVTMLYDGKPDSAFEARFGTADYLLGPGIGWRRADPAACAGQWVGSLTEDPTLPGPTGHPVYFTVNDNGWVGQAEGLPEHVTGRLYGLALRSTPGELKVAGTLSTGDLGAYRRVQLSGRILDRVFQGVFWTADDAVRGTAEFQRID